MDNNIIDKRANFVLTEDFNIFMSLDFASYKIKLKDLGIHQSSSEKTIATKYLFNIVSEHDKLVSQRELLLEALKEVIDIENYYNVDENSNNILLKAQEVIKKCEPLT